jgi:UDP-N-acetylglucosamine 4,6-dehydratase
MQTMLESFSDKTLLVTGGTGSFGNAVVSKFLKTNIREIRIFSRDEKKQEDMRTEYRDQRLKFYIGDVRDYRSIHNAMRGVDHVFSAAALKQVPSCEFYPLEAVNTNIIGTENTLNAAIEHCVQSVIVLSTDKAVHPVNAMGMSKALMEKVAIAKSRNNPTIKTKICVTRYGNVMASRGSVIPLFISQLKKGLPITITDPEMTRFMMSLPEAVDLVLFAFQNGTNGDTFIQKSPATTIGKLANALKQIFHPNAEIKVIGTRHGEKKHESLLSAEEMTRAIDLPHYYRVCPDARDLNYSIYFEKGEERKPELTEYNSQNTTQLSTEELTNRLLSLDYVKTELQAN